MDLTLLPVSMSKIRQSDKEAIRDDREKWWNHFYSKYEKLSEVTDETVGIEEIDDPNMCVDREDDLGMEGFRLEPIVSRTFQRWVHDHEDEIDELTTIAGPPGEDEEEINGSDEEETEYETEECDYSPEELSDGTPAKSNISRNLFTDSDSSDEESDVGEAMPMSLSSLLLSPARGRPTSSFVDKFLSPKVQLSRLSPKVLLSRNASLVDESVNNSSLVCEACSLETEYSRDMGIEEGEDEKFECDNCLLNIHQDCEEECQLCRHIASKVDTRRRLKMKFEVKGCSDTV